MKLKASEDVDELAMNSLVAPEILVAHDATEPPLFPLLPRGLHLGPPRRRRVRTAGSVVSDAWALLSPPPRWLPI